MKMGERTIAVIFLMMVSFVSWSGQIVTDDTPSSTAAAPEEGRIVNTVNEFGYNLMLKMMKQKVNKNVILSPTGIAGLMAMVLLGSVGSSYDELARVLGFSQDILTNRQNHENFGNLLQKLNSNVPNAEHPKTESTPLLIGNATKTIEESKEILSRTIYADAVVVDNNTRVRTIYRDYLERVYHGDALSVKFGDTINSQQLINDWVKNHTEGKIEDFLKEPLPINTKVVLLSALYFSGQWAQPFVSEYTRQMIFHTPNGDVHADLMLNLGQFNYTFKSEKGVHVIAFPYKDSSTTMYVLKPYPKKTSLPEMLETLNFSTIEGLINGMTPQQCVVRFPKMDLKARADLKDSLKELGLKSVFSPGDANFALMVDNTPVNKKEDELLSRIIEGEETESERKIKEIINSLPNPGVYVDAVLHDVKMTINEYGTVAVAASSGLLSRTAKMFYVDSPFYMFIRNEKTKLVTFSAAIFDPTDSF